MPLLFSLFSLELSKADGIIKSTSLKSDYLQMGSDL